MSQSNAQQLRPGVDAYGFRVQDVTPVDEVRSVAYLLEHQATGARLLHLQTDDPENLFSVSFPTPPADDTGIAHILEHCVLAGSERYPVREPFFEMIKMSMATFINAMTGPDCTYYPVASNVRQDLFNLAEVYMDAAFRPLLTEQTFRREGHHLAPIASGNGNGSSAAGAGLTISGIVYNEMQGVFSDPESRLGRAITHALMPDTIYARESGGDPDAIPDLTYETFRQFHQTYYHPSNAYFFAYGDIPTSEYCRFIDQRLGGFERRPVAFEIGRQPRWTAPRTLDESYPIASGEPQTERTFLTECWLTGDATDPQDVVLMRILSLILAGNEAAPLKKAIIGSKLGGDLTYAGSSGIGLEEAFYVGIRASEPDRAEAFAHLVQETLASIASGGISTEMVETALRQSAFEYLEVQPMYPLHTMSRVLDAWIYDRDPLSFLRMSSHLEACRQRWQREPDLFERLIRERLLDNPHRLSAVMQPDTALQQQLDQAFARRVEQATAGLGDADRARIAEQASELERINSTPNPPEALARLPQLRVQDLPDRLQHVPTSVSDVAGVTLLRNDVFSNGVNYLALDFAVDDLPAELWPYLPRYLEAVGKLGAAGQGYEEVARRRASATGGIGSSVAISGHASDAGRTLRSVRMSLKALDDQMPVALGVLGDLLFAVDPRDRARLEEVLVQSRVRYRSSLVRDGAHTAALHAGRGLSLEGFLDEQLGGLPQLELCEQLTAQFAAEHGALMERIEQIRDFLLGSGRLTVSFTGSDAAADALQTALRDWSSRLGKHAGQRHGNGAGAGGVQFSAFDEPPREGLAAQMQVAFCAQLMPAPHLSHPDSVLLSVGGHLLSLDYILPEIRFKGNAYGAWFRYSPLGGEFALGSYRDPHITRTLQVFADTAGHAAAAQWSDVDVGRAVIAVAKRDQAPLRPRPATQLALQRHLTGITPEMREQRFARLKAATAADVARATRSALDAGFPRSAVCVVSSREKLAQANSELDLPLAVENILRREE